MVTPVLLHLQFYSQIFKFFSFSGSLFTTLPHWHFPLHGNGYCHNNNKFHLMKHVLCEDSTFCEVAPQYESYTRNLRPTVSKYYIDCEQLATKIKIRTYSHASEEKQSASRNGRYKRQKTQFELIFTAPRIPWKAIFHSNMEWAIPGQQPCLNRWKIFFLTPQTRNGMKWVSMATVC